MMTKHIVRGSVVALALALTTGCKKEGTDTNTKANLRPEQDQGPTRPSAEKAVEPPTPTVTGDRSGVSDGGVGDGGASPQDGGVAGDGRMKAETPFDDESSKPPIDAGQ
jgi:hypothetical protein